jgi:hypothetical protein
MKRNEMDNKIPLGIWQMIAIFFVMIFLPLCGVWFSGKELLIFLEFPPLTQYVEHAGFSWFVFIAVIFAVLAVIKPLLIRVALNCSQPENIQRYSFPL